jgi:hypothetical protein
MPRARGWEGKKGKRKNEKLSFHEHKDPEREGSRLSAGENMKLNENLYSALELFRRGRKGRKRAMIFLN